MAIPLTGFYAGLLGILYIVLSIRVVKARMAAGVAIGYGENKDLRRAIRVHANFTEYVPLALILIACVELNVGKPQAVHGFGGALVVARLAHAYGLSATIGLSKGRQLGWLLTCAVILAAAVYNVYGFVVGE